MVSIVKKAQERIDAGGNSRQLLPDLNEVITVTKNVDTTIKIDIDDVKDEIEYWNSSVVCYVLGANPPFLVMVGYLRQIWANKGIEKIVAVNKGVFIVRFHTVDQRDAVLTDGFQFFDKKLLVVKKWDSEMNVQKEELKTIPICIQLPALDLKYWGESAYSS